MKKSKAPTVEEQLVALAERVAQLETDCPHCVGAREERELRARQAPMAEAQRRRDDARRARIASDNDKDPILRIGLDPKIYRVDSEILDELGLGRLQRVACVRTSEWQALRRRHSGDVAFALEEEGTLIVKRVDDPTVIESFYGGEA